MTKLKLGVISDDKPVKVTIEIAASVYQDLVAYADALGRQTGQTISEPTKLIVPMLVRFMDTDRAFKKANRVTHHPLETGGSRT
jgi:hypothetical protein